VCAYGVVSGYVCGNLIEINVELAIPNPFNLVNEGDDTINFLTAESLNKLDLGENGFYGEGDLGGPVYMLSNIGDRTTAQALGHITHFDNSDPQHKLLYYMPLDKDLGKIFDAYKCSYTPLIYNESNSQEYQQLLAQIEIPPKK
jgi:hypothetical protein